MKHAWVINKNASKSSWKNRKKLSAKHLKSIHSLSLRLIFQKLFRHFFVELNCTENSSILNNNKSFFFFYLAIYLHKENYSVLKVKFDVRYKLKSAI